MFSTTEYISCDNFVCEVYSNNPILPVSKFNTEIFILDRNKIIEKPSCEKQYGGRRATDNYWLTMVTKSGKQPITKYILPSVCQEYSEVLYINLQNKKPFENLRLQGSIFGRYMFWLTISVCLLILFQFIEIRKKKFW